MYYHDVGKTIKPQYFIENQPEGLNPHDSLESKLSADIVKEHVTEGLRLAKESNLPVVVQDFISEHHGTQLISIFYNQAMKEAEEEGVTREDFTYPGPKPQSRETAIAMMADSIESATRVLQEPNPDRLRKLVEELIHSKQEDGQLDESPLTLSEIRILKRSFADTLASIHHRRIDYPSSQHLTKAPTPHPQSVPTKNEDDEQIELGSMNQESDQV